MTASLQLAADDLLSSYIVNKAQAIEAAAAVCPAHQVCILVLHGPKPVALMTTDLCGCYHWG